MINNKLIDHSSNRKDIIRKKIHKISTKIPKIAIELKKIRKNTDVDAE
jgi:hypothetical protein